MKPMAMILGAVLWCVSVVVAQDHDWLSGTWNGNMMVVSLEFMTSKKHGSA